MSDFCENLALSEPYVRKNNCFRRKKTAKSFLEARSPQIRLLQQKIDANAYHAV